MKMVISKKLDKIILHFFRTVEWEELISILSDKIGDIVEIKETEAKVWNAGIISSETYMFLDVKHLEKFISVIYNISDKELEPYIEELHMMYNAKKSKKYNL